MRALRLFLEESRPCVQIIFFLRFLAGAVTTTAHRPAGWGHQLIGPGIAWLLASLFAYGLNGVSDVAEDRVNGTGRPIARGELSPRTAAALTWTAAGGSLATALACGDALFVGFVLLYLVIGYAYSGAPFQLKCSALGASGAVLVMGLLTYAAGWQAVGGGAPSAATVALAVTMSLWMCVVGAVTKDFSHARGDAAAGRRTSVTAWGPSAARLVAAVGAPAVAAGFLHAGLSSPVLRVPSLVLLGGALTVAVLCWTTRHDPARGRTPYRAFMVSQHLVHVALFLQLAV
ncbi:UbiA family prenyltransferase [Streptomyces caniferus]|uniref:UbiA family prenyltransferase n=1 Tax=Streptomyces caniferus TaxID=285557 RepID=UPI00371B6EF7